MTQRVNEPRPGAVPVIDEKARAEGRARMQEQHERDGIDDKIAAAVDLIDVKVIKP